MALARTIFALAPLVIKAQSRRPAKRLAGAIMFAVLMGLAGLFLISAGFVWVMKSYGAEFGFLAVSAAFFVLAVLMYFLSRRTKMKPVDVAEDFRPDPLAKYIPEDMQNDPRILAFMEKIKDNPVETTASAVALGFIISTQLFGD